LNPVHKISKSGYDSQNVKSKLLSINLRIDGLSFVIMDADIILYAEYYEWQNNGWKHAGEQFKIIFSQNSVLLREFKKTFIILNSKESTLVPIKFYDRSKEVIIIKTLLGIEDFDTYSHNLKNAEVVLISALRTNLNQLIKNTFPKAEMLNYSSLFIDEAIKLSVSKQILLLNIGQQSFEVVSTNFGKINSHNYFDFTTSDEFMFFLLSFVKQNNIAIEKIHLLLSGKIAMDSKIGKSLKKYFPVIEQMQTTDNDKEGAFVELKKYTLIANS